MYFFLYFRHAVPSKIYDENWVGPFLVIFAHNKLKKGLIFGIQILDMCSKWLLDAFNIHFIYFKKKICFRKSIVFGFLVISKNVSNSTIFRPKFIYHFFGRFYYEQSFLVYWIFFSIFLVKHCDKLEQNMSYSIGVVIFCSIK